jgi:hypothetical protein
MGVFLSVIVRYFSFLVLLLFSFLCLLAGLYYLAEFVEENTRVTKRVMNLLMWAVLALHIGLALFDSLPFLHLLFSLACHFVYSSLLAAYPFINVSSPNFLLSAALAFANHFLWFYYFAYNYHDTADVIGFFVTCVWLVPFSFFISLSANDNVLPFVGSPPPSEGEGGGKKRSNIILAFMRFLGRTKESVLPTTSSSAKML